MPSWKKTQERIVIALNYFLVVSMLMSILTIPFCGCVFPSNETVLEFSKTLGCKNVEVTDRFRFSVYGKGCQPEENVAFEVKDHCSNKLLVICGRAFPVNPRLRVAQTTVVPQ